MWQAAAALLIIFLRSVDHESNLLQTAEEQRNRGSRISARTAEASATPDKSSRNESTNMTPASVRNATFAATQQIKKQEAVSGKRPGSARCIEA
jgi:hypothetical protein